MTTTVCEVFKKGTERFNAHDLDGFAEVLADEVADAAPVRGAEKAARVSFFGRWVGAFPKARLERVRIAKNN